MVTANGLNMGKVWQHVVDGGSNSVLDKVSRWLLAAVFLYAGIPKIADLDLFAKIIGAYGLLPDVLLFPAAVLLSLAEVTAAVLLLCARREGLWLTAILMLCFIAVLGYGIQMGLDIDCGCFGPDDPEHTAFSGLRTALWRDLLLCVPLLYGFWYHFYTTSQTYGEKQ